MGLFSRSVDVADLKSRRDFEGLADVLKKNDDDQRRQAVDAIAELGDPAAVAPIVEMASRLRTRSESYESAQEAIQRLGPVAVEPLKELVRAQGSLGASSQLARLGEDAGLEPLRELSREADSDARQAAFGGLNELSTPAAVAALAEAAEAGPGRGEAIEVMARNSACAGDARAVAAVVGAMGEEDAELRAAAGRALTGWTKMMREGEADPTAAREQLTASVGHESPRVRVAVVMSLAASFPESEELSPEAGDVLFGACSDEHEGVRGIAALGLAERGDRRAYDTLIAVLPSDNPEVAGAGVVGLKKLGDPAALPAIRARLDAESDKTTALARELVHTRNDLKAAEKKLAKAG